MSIKSSISILTGKSSYWFLHTFLKSGSSFPGQIALNIDPNILHTLGEKYDVILVTGTNGKTLTTALTTKILQKSNFDVITNPTGSNMIQGIITAFFAHKNKKNKKQIVVLEADEANIKLICQYLSPKAFVLTNIFRDQMDRYGEIYVTYNKIIEGIKLVPSATLIINGDEPIFMSEKLPNYKLYYGFDNGNYNDNLVAPPNTDGILCPICHHILHYHFIIYGNLGDYFCPNCGFKRPKLDFKVNKIINETPTSSKFEINNYPFEIKVGGQYNIYNTLAAYSVGRFMHIGPKIISEACQYDEKIFGRQETFKINNKKITIILVKNPVGLDQVLNMIGLNKNKFSLFFLLNSQYADGIDTSWIWDSNWEKFVSNNKVTDYVVGGERFKDANLRLKIAGVNSKNITTIHGLDDIINKIKDSKSNDVYILSTYTAMLQLRKLLIDKNYINK